MKKAKWEKDEKDGTLYKDCGKLLLMLLKSEAEAGAYRMHIVTNKTHTGAFTAKFTAKNEKSAKRKADHDFTRLIRAIQRIEK